MATIQTVMALQDKMSKQLDAIQKATENANKSFKNVNISIDNVDKKMQKASTSSNSFFSSLLKFNLLSNIFSMITGQIGSAIERFDTLNNYEKVVGNLGFTAESAQKSITRLKNGLDGLPTTLQDSVTSVQRFASANGNLEASTEMFLSLNDAILAGGAPLAMQQSALEQISQAYSKGKFDAMEWRTMLIAMPAQLKQIAESMGYTNTAVGGDFYNALQKGKIGMNDFMKQIVELDDGVKGFHKQALDATDGIQTAMANMRTAITKGLTDLIDKTNQALADSGLPTIQEMITKVGKTIQSGLITIGNLMVQITPIIKAIYDTIVQSWDFIKIAAPILIGYLVALKSATIAQAIATGILNSALLASPITWIILAIIGIIALIFMIIDAINDLTGSSLNSIGVIVGGLFAGAALIENTFIGLYNVLTGISNGIALMFIGMTQIIISNINAIAEAIDFVFGSNLASATTGLMNKLNSAAKGILEDGGYIEFKSISDAYDKGYGIGEQFSSKTKDLTKDLSGANLEKSVIDWNSLSNTVGTDSTGGKAVKTTTKDDLLSDDDIQILLDIATRDYQLNYQQVTPNVMVSFGDVRETADVNDVLNAVGDKIFEFINADAEVPIG